jgi:hypothetical protein
LEQSDSQLTLGVYRHAARVGSHGSAASLAKRWHASAPDGTSGEVASFLKQANRNRKAKSNSSFTLYSGVLRGSSFSLFRGPREGLAEVHEVLQPSAASSEPSWLDADRATVTPTPSNSRGDRCSGTIQSTPPLAEEGVQPK